jgi:hypothetical protein
MPDETKPQPQRFEVSASGIKIFVTDEGDQSQWVMFKRAWTWKDKSRFAAVVTDNAALGVALDFMTDWNIRDSSGKPIAFNREILKSTVAEWDVPIQIPAEIIRAVWTAISEASKLPLASS